MTTLNLATNASSQLLAARRSAAIVRWADILPASREAAYAVQDASMAGLGATGGWKVGAKSPDAEPTCAPLPASGLLASGVRLAGQATQMRGIEVEAALRLGRDINPQGKLLTPAELAEACDAVLPVIEVVETRLADWPGSGPLAQLADLQSHGALILGAPLAMQPAQLDLRLLHAHLMFNGDTVSNTQGGNPAQDVWRMLAWLALHCAQRGQPLRAGQIITTGSCTGMLFAPAGALVQAELSGPGSDGQVAVQF